MLRLVDTKITIGSADILLSPEIKNFGIMFDSQMSPKITTLCRSLNFSLCLYRKYPEFGDMLTRKLEFIIIIIIITKAFM